MEKPVQTDDISEASEPLVVVEAEPPNQEASIDALVAPITAEPFVRTNFAVPVLPVDQPIAVMGAVARPFEVRRDELCGLPARDVVMTLECAGNDRVGMAPLAPGVPWDRGAVSTAHFRGVPLIELLWRAGLHEDVIEIGAEGADRGTPDGSDRSTPFVRALPLDKALDPDTILAYEMNGAPLTPKHGAPLRLVVPGWYGMASVKWLVRLEARIEPFEGWFQSERYVYDYADDLPTTPVREMHPKALLVEPQGRTRAGSVRIAGWAWGGESIVKVEISIDAGEWKEAVLGPPLGRFAWRRFELAWDARPGRHALRARASDASGNVQPEWSRFNKHGYGNNAVRVTLIDVI